MSGEGFRYKPQTEDTEQVDEGRRRALRAAVAGGIAGVGGPVLMHMFEEPSQSNEARSAVYREQANDDAGSSETTLIQEEAMLTDTETVLKTLTEQLKDGGRVTLNDKTLRAMTETWERQYGKGGVRHKDLLDALKRMSEWRERIEHIFEAEGVPRELALLAIPESHFQVEARSPAGAAGPYQFMKATAKLDVANLRVHETLDERFDPLKSARACARLLKDNYRLLNNDWDLALSAYNGSFAWTYAKERQRMSERNYADFLKFMEGRINALVDKRRADAGKQSSALPSNMFDDYVQNITYPAKYRAVTEVLRRTPEKAEWRVPVQYREHTVRRIRGQQVKHRVRANDTLYNIARTYQVSARAIADANPVVKQTGKLTANTDLKIPRDGTNESLKDVSEAYGIPLASLRALNPAVRIPEAPLPDRYSVRIPMVGGTRVAGQ